jgi:hypothetical protein
MAKNDFLARQAIARDCYFRAGLEAGRQQIIDMVVLVLRDHEIMGKDTFGKERLLKIINGVGDYIDKFQPAWEKNDETDYYRSKLDAALAEAFGDGMHDTFSKRYESAPGYDYKKGKWKR